MTQKIKSLDDLLSAYSLADNRLPEEVFIDMKAYAKQHHCSIDEVASLYHNKGILTHHNPYDYRNFKTASEFYEGVDGRVPLQMMHGITTLQKRINGSFQEVHKRLIDRGAIVNIV